MLWKKIWSYYYCCVSTAAIVCLLWNITLALYVCVWSGDFNSMPEHHNKHTPTCEALEIGINLMTTNNARKWISSKLATTSNNNSTRHSGESVAEFIIWNIAITWAHIDIAGNIQQTTELLKIMIITISHSTQLGNYYINLPKWMSHTVPCSRWKCWRKELWICIRW